MSNITLGNKASRSSRNTKKQTKDNLFLYVPLYHCAAALIDSGFPHHFFDGRESLVNFLHARIPKR